MRSVKSVIGILVLFFVVVVGVAACSSAPQRQRFEMEQSDYTKWEIVQSPITGKCYEVLSHLLGYTNGVMTATEVDCKFLTGE